MIDLIVERDKFTIQISEDSCVDVALLTPLDWSRINSDAKYLLSTGYCSKPSEAYICAFIALLHDLQALSDYDHTKDKFI